MKHDRRVLRVTLNEPPSVNRLWRSVLVRGRPRALKAKAYRDYEAGAWLACRAAKLRPLAGDVAVTLTWYRSAKRGDLDGRLKAVLDVLQGHAYISDNQVVALHAWRVDGDTERSGTVEVTVEAAA